MKRFILSTVVAVAAACGGSSAFAGPFILAGTDADDHGSATSTANVDGWLFMQRALENLGAAVTNGNKVVTILGSTTGSKAHDAASSAFDKSSLKVAGWTLQTVAAVSFGTFFGGGIANAGVLMMDSGFNVSGGVDGSAFNTFATTIDTFLGAGGGLFSQANGYSWLSGLVPGLKVVDGFETGLALTAAGNSSFPGLTNADLSAGPWHNSFTGFGSIPVLATSSTAGGTFGDAVIIGGATGSITAPPSTVPEPSSLALVVLAMVAAGAAAKRKRIS